VVAAEVKELSRQTATATRDITERIRTMQEATAGSVTAIRSVESAVRQMDVANSAVAAAIEQQEATLREISERLQAAAGNTSAVDQTIGIVAGRGQALEALSQQTQASTALADERARELHGNVLLVLRRMSLMGENWNKHIPIQTPCRYAAAGFSGEAFLLEVSEFAALVRIPAEADQALEALPPGSLISVTLPEAGVLQGTMDAYSNGRALVLPRPGPEHRWVTLAPIIAAAQQTNARFIDAAQAGAAHIAARLESAVEARQLTMDELFDTAYKMVPGSDPAQFTTRFTEKADRLVQPILDEMLNFDAKVVGTFVVDRMGYAPTHNARVSHPQRPDDPAWNAKNCRPRRRAHHAANAVAELRTRHGQWRTHDDQGSGFTNPCARTPLGRTSHYVQQLSHSAGLLSNVATHTPGRIERSFFFQRRTAVFAKPEGQPFLQVGMTCPHTVAVIGSCFSG
jgi:methyl-accepting chemotaxis protein